MKTHTGQSRAHRPCVRHRAVVTARTPAAVTALAIAGLFATASATVHTAPTSDAEPVAATSTLPRHVGILYTKSNSLLLQPITVESPGLSNVSRAPAIVETASVTAPTVRGIPAIALAAYRNAELVIAQTQPDCGIDWSLLAGIGRIESGHANGGNTDAEGTTRTPILGPALDGTLVGNEVIADGQGSYVRAIGPMQFLPTTWGAYASDGNGDGESNPNDVFDAALGAARYLCSGGMNLRDSTQRLRAVLRYNNSAAYASDVLGWASTYSGNGSAPVENVAVTVTDGPSESVPTTENRSTPGADAPRAEDPNMPAAEPTPPPMMIQIPGLPPIPCGLFCPLPAA
jgi:membrane-bound lytic murein transglycosylase B